MAAGGHRRQRGIAAGTPGEDVAHPVDGDGAAGLLAPAHEEVAPLAVVVAERQAAVAAGHARTDIRHLHEAVPQAVAVHLQVLEIYCIHRLPTPRSEEHTSELQSLMRISYAVFCLKNNKRNPYVKLQLQPYPPPYNIVPRNM